MSTTTTGSAELLLAALANQRIVAIDGKNFSGRSNLLLRFCRNRSDGRAYLGPEIYFALSGLTTTVRQELELHAGCPLESSGFLEESQKLKLTNLLESHPASLSGGEQTCLAVLCAMILKPNMLAVDCALEQLDGEKLNISLDLLRGTSGPSQGTVVTDNRLDEWSFAGQTIDIASLKPQVSRLAPVPPLNPALLKQADPVAAPVIELQNITAAYDKNRDVLANVNLTLQPARVYTLQGKNGSGKSTLAKVLCGVLRPSEGRVLLDRKPATPWKTPGKTAGYHLQNPDVGLFESTVAAELGLKPGDKQTAIIRDVFGLQPFAHSNPLALPFPIRKRVSLAATIARRPPWIILDEPTLGGDADTIVALAQIMHALAKKGHGVIVISHSRKLLEMLKGNSLRTEAGQVVQSTQVPSEV